MNAKGALFLALVIVAGSPSLCWALPLEGNIDVQPISVGPVADPVPGDPGIPNDLSYATKIYSQIGITVSSLRDDVLIVEDNNADGVWSSAEFTGTLNDMGRGKPGNPIYLYYVADYDTAGPGGVVGQAFSEEDVTAGTVKNAGVVLQASRRNDTVAHEIGHILTDEWRWKTPESSGGVHSNQANDLMATGAIRNIPTKLDDVYPTGSNDEIRNTVGPLSTSATAIVPLPTAMYFQSSFVTTTFRDEVGVGVGITDASGGGPTVSAGPIAWGTETTLIDVPHSTTWRVSEAARKVGTDIEQYGLWFHSDEDHTASKIIEFAMTDIDSNGYNFSDILDATVRVELYSNILTDAGKVTLTPGTDYSWSSVIDLVEGDLNQFGVTIHNSSVFAGVHDFYLSFNASMTAIPEPSSIALGAIGVALLFVARRHRRSGEARSLIDKPTP